MHMRTRAAVVGGLVILGLGLGGCSAIESILGGGQSVTRDSQTQEVTEAGKADVFALRVGDCFDDEGATSAEITDVPAVPCAEPHDNEVYYEFRMTGDEWPGKDAIDAQADAQCAPQFESFVGIAEADSVLAWYPIQPTQGSWESGNDRVVQCAVYEQGVKVQGSLAGVAR